MKDDTNTEEKNSNIESVTTGTSSNDVDVDNAGQMGNDAQKQQAAFGTESRGFKRRRNERRPSKRTEKPRQEFDQKMLSIRRVARVTSGGRRFSFSASVVIGDRKGRVGVGLGKSADTPLAVEKAVRAARKSMATVYLKNSTIPHAVEAKFGSSVVHLMRAPGKGIVAGSAVRAVLELAGVKEVSGKILSRSKNELNIARATINALQKLIKNKKTTVTK